ncbi:hypothetical protein RRF57_000490 [Xylaria bambusicola]|uniref:Uncharacterized protein n=1 Tax=Xylaria bambusicola TaxID=326684 RepID=A0AAN7U9X0_9PEZI
MSAETEISGFFALVEMSKKRRCCLKPSKTLDACSATKPPILSLALTYLSTDWLMKLSNSSTDSGRFSWGAGVETAGVPEVDADGNGVADWSGGDVTALDRAGTAWGSSMVDEAMSSRRVVAASNLAAMESERRCKVLPKVESRLTVLSV